MAQNLCDYNKQIVSDFKTIKEEQDKIVSRLDNIFQIDGKLINKLEDYLEENFPNLETGDLVSKPFDDILNEVFPGTKNDRIRTAINLKALLLTNESWATYAEKTILYPMDQNYKPLSGKVVDLGAVKLGTLRKLYYDIRQSAISDGNNFGRGIFGRFAIQFSMPRRQKRREPTGAWGEVSDAGRDYPTKVSQRINDFIKSPRQRKSKLKYGWGDIVEDLENTIEGFTGDIIEELVPGYFRLSAKDDLKRRLIRFFIFSVKGDARGNTIIRLAKDQSDFEIASVYRPSGQFYNNDDTDQMEKVWIHTDYVPLKEFHGGKFYIDFKKLSLPDRKFVFDKINKLKEKFRALDNELMEYTNIEYPKSVKAILSAVKSTFNLNGAELNYALLMIQGKKRFTPERIDLKDYDEFIINKLGDSLEKFKLLAETFSSTAVLYPYFDSKIDKKVDHFPTTYSMTKLPQIYTETINSMQANIDEELIPKLEIAREEGNEKGIKFLEKEIIRESQKIERMSKLRKDIMGFTLDESNIEGAEGELVPAIAQQKFAKRVTNMISPLYMRATSDSYYHALKSIMSSIERNYLLANLIKQIGRKNVAMPVVKEAINTFKVPFGFTSTEGGLGPFNLSSDSISSSLNKVPFVNMTPDRADRIMRTMSSMATGQLLSGVGTAITNLTAIGQNIWDTGFRETCDACMLYFKSKGFQELISSSGVTEFRDFFNKSLTNDYIDESIELDTHKQIMGAVIRFYSDKKSFGLKKATDNLENTMKDICNSSPAYVTKFGNVSDIPTLKEAKRFKRTIKGMQFRSMVNRYVSFAINKETEFSPLLSKSVVRRALKSAITKPIELFAAINRAIPGLTMSDGESLIRTVSFIMGIKSAQRAGILNQGTPESFLPGGQNYHQYELAIAIGLHASRRANFDLVPQGKGKLFYSVAGNNIAKLKIWQVEKDSVDYNMLKDGLKSMLKKAETDLLLEKDAKRRNAMKKAIIYIKLLSRAFAQIVSTKGKFLSGKARSRNLREGQFPQLGRVVSFLQSGMLFVFLFDFLILNPFVSRQISWILRRAGVTRFAGAKSNLLSTASILPILYLQLLYQVDDEEEANEAYAKAVYDLARNSPIGFFVMQPAELLFQMATGYSISYGRLKNMEDEDINFRDTVGGKLTRLAQPGGSIGRELTKDIPDLFKAIFSPFVRDLID